MEEENGIVDEGMAWEDGLVGFGVGVRTLWMHGFMIA